MASCTGIDPNNAQHFSQTGWRFIYISSINIGGQLNVNAIPGARVFDLGQTGHNTTAVFQNLQTRGSQAELASLVAERLVVN